MPVLYSDNIKTARMTAARDACANGTLEVLSETGAVLVVYGLSANGGVVSGSTWTLAFDATSLPAIASGIPTSARIRTAAGALAVAGLNAGQDFTVNVTSVSVGQTVDIGLTVINHA